MQERGGTQERGGRKRGLEKERNAEIELAGQMDRALALLQPQPNKEICPLMMCWLSNRKRKVTWIMCDVYDQWYHVGCVGLTAKKKSKLLRHLALLPLCIEFFVP